MFCALLLNCYVTVGVSIDLPRSQIFHLHSESLEVPSSTRLWYQIWPSCPTEPRPLPRRAFPQRSHKGLSVGEAARSFLSVSRGAQQRPARGSAVTACYSAPVVGPRSPAGSWPCPRRPPLAQPGLKTRPAGDKETTGGKWKWALLKQRCPRGCSSAPGPRCKQEGSAPWQFESGFRDKGSFSYFSGCNCVHKTCRINSNARGLTEQGGQGGNG